jgi:hypothetical protein
MKRSLACIVVWSCVGVVWGADIVGYTLLDGAPVPKKKVVHHKSDPADEKQPAEQSIDIAEARTVATIPRVSSLAVSSAPEPASVVLLGLGAGPLLLRRRNKR